MSLRSDWSTKQVPGYIKVHRETLPLKKNQEINKNSTKNKWKWKYIAIKFVGNIENSYMSKIYNSKCLHLKKNRKSINKWLTGVIPKQEQTEFNPLHTKKY